MYWNFIYDRLKERQKRNYSINSTEWHRQNQFQVVRNFSVKCKIVKLLEDSLGEFFLASGQEITP